MDEKVRLMAEELCDEDRKRVSDIFPYKGKIEWDDFTNYQKEYYGEWAERIIDSEED